MRTVTCLTVACLIVATAAPASAQGNDQRLDALITAYRLSARTATGPSHSTTEESAARTARPLDPDGWRERFAEVASTTTDPEVAVSAWTWVARIKGTDASEPRLLQAAIDAVLSTPKETRALEDFVEAIGSRTEAQQSLGLLARSANPSRARAAARWFVVRHELNQLAERESPTPSILEALESLATDEDAGPWAERASGALAELTVFVPGALAPDFEAKDQDGATFRLSDSRGSVVLLDFFGYWSVPCRNRIPDQRALIDEFKDRPFVIIGINGDTPEDFRSASKTLPISWRTVLDGRRGPLATRWCVRSFPTLVLLDHEGRIVNRWVGNRGPAVLTKAVNEQLARAEGRAEPGINAATKTLRSGVSRVLLTFGITEHWALGDVSHRKTATGDVESVSLTLTSSSRVAYAFDDVLKLIAAMEKDGLRVKAADFGVKLTGEQAGAFLVQTLTVERAILERNELVPVRFTDTFANWSWWDPTGASYEKFAVNEQEIRLTRVVKGARRIDLDRVRTGWGFTWGRYQSMSVGALSARGEDLLLENVVIALAQ